MLSTCGQAVGSLRISTRKTRARVSPVSFIDLYAQNLGGVKVSFLRKLSVSFTPYISPPKLAVLPLFEHYFYPVSTEPINNCNPNKFKER